MKKKITNEIFYGFFSMLSLRKLVYFILTAHLNSEQNSKSSRATRGWWLLDWTV